MLHYFESVIYIIVICFLLGLLICSLSSSRKIRYKKISLDGQEYHYRVESWPGMVMIYLYTRSKLCRQLAARPIVAHSEFIEPELIIKNAAKKGRIEWF